MGAWLKPQRTICIGTKLWDYVPDPNIDDPEETLILLFKLLLIKHLDSKDTRFIDAAINEISNDEIQYSPTARILTSQSSRSNMGSGCVC